MEPRRHPLLSHVIAQFASRLPATWRFHCFHGTANVRTAEAAAWTPRVILSNLGVPSLAPKDIAYNRLLTSSWFWETVANATPSASHALVFQTDTALCGGGAGRASNGLPLFPPSISEFLQYGYVGAPWPRTILRSPDHASVLRFGGHHALQLAERSPPSSSSSSSSSSYFRLVGNGGLSLRRVEDMVRVCASVPWDA